MRDTVIYALGAAAFVVFTALRPTAPLLQIAYAVLFSCAAVRSVLAERWWRRYEAAKVSAKAPPGLLESLLPPRSS